MNDHPVFTALLSGVALAVSFSAGHVSAEAEKTLPPPRLPLVVHVAGNTQNAAEARLSPTKGYTATAVLHFDEVAGGLVQVSAQIQGLEPGPHGFHIHENGDCSSPDASSAGGHFSPQQHPHGAPTSSAKERHAGDLGNVIADDNGIVVLTDKTFEIELNGPNSIIGRAVILHEREDDLKTQPAGDAGNPVACGVITAPTTPG
jgi:Cu-Zn family superoxide dismutase